MDSKAVQTNVEGMFLETLEAIIYEIAQRVGNFLLYIAADAVIRETEIGLGFLDDQ
jgi:hypothetical protein